MEKKSQESDLYCVEKRKGRGCVLIYQKSSHWNWKRKAVSCRFRSNKLWWSGCPPSLPPWVSPASHSNVRYTAAIIIVIKWTAMNILSSRRRSSACKATRRQKSLPCGYIYPCVHDSNVIMWSANMRL